MTVCIAALSDNGQNCVLASDLMITAHIPIGYEFESAEVEKIISVNDTIYSLVAGDVLFAQHVIDLAKQTLVELRDTSVENAAEEIRKAYQKVRMTQVVRANIETRGLDLKTYYQMQQKLMPAIVQMIDLALMSHNPLVELLVAGQDNSGCHLYSVQNPGISICHDAIGFVAIGSGGPHAIYSLIGSKYKKSMSNEEVYKIVEIAKKRSEVAPGVGEDTLMKTTKEKKDA